MKLRLIFSAFCFGVTLPAFADFDSVMCKATDQQSDLQVSLKKVASSINGYKFLAQVTESHPQKFSDTFLLSYYDSGHFLFFYDSTAVDPAENPIPLQFSLSRLRPGPGWNTAGLSIAKVGEFQTGTTAITSVPVLNAEVSCLGANF